MITNFFASQVGSKSFLSTDDCVVELSVDPVKIIYRSLYDFWHITQQDKKLKIMFWHIVNNDILKLKVFHHSIKYIFDLIFLIFLFLISNLWPHYFSIPSPLSCTPSNFVSISLVVFFFPSVFLLSSASNFMIKFNNNY